MSENQQKQQTVEKDSQRLLLTKVVYIVWDAKKKWQIYW